MNRDRTPPTRGRKLARELGLPQPGLAPQSKTCRKRAYRTYDEALRVAVKRCAPYPLRIYKCADCAAHHLTSRPARST